jgi:hypothetical protein
MPGFVLEPHLPTSLAEDVTASTDDATTSTGRHIFKKSLVGRQGYTTSPDPAKP